MRKNHCVLLPSFWLSISLCFVHQPSQLRRRLAFLARVQMRQVLAARTTEPRVGHFNQVQVLTHQLPPPPVTQLPAQINLSTPPLPPLTLLPLPTLALQVQSRSSLFHVVVYGLTAGLALLSEVWNHQTTMFDLTWYIPLSFNSLRLAPPFNRSHSLCTLFLYRLIVPSIFTLRAWLVMLQFI